MVRNGPERVDDEVTPPDLKRQERLHELPGVQRRPERRTSLLLHLPLPVEREERDLDPEREQEGVLHDGEPALSLLPGPEGIDHGGEAEAINHAGIEGMHRQPGLLLVGGGQERGEPGAGLDTPVGRVAGRGASVRGGEPDPQGDERNDAVGVELKLRCWVLWCGEVGDEEVVAQVGQVADQSYETALQDLPLLQRGSDRAVEQRTLEQRYRPCGVALRAWAHTFLPRPLQQRCSPFP